LDHRRRNGSISLRVRCIKLCPTLHVGWLAVFRAIRPALGIIVSGQLGFVNAANQNAEQPAPPKSPHRAPFAPVGGSEYAVPMRGVETQKRTPYAFGRTIRQPGWASAKTSAARSDYFLCAGKKAQREHESPPRLVLPSGRSRPGGSGHRRRPRRLPGSPGPFSGSPFRFAFGRKSKSLFALPTKARNAWPDARWTGSNARPDAT